VSRLREGFPARHSRRPRAGHARHVVHRMERL
jgi:hypothetical protein